MKKIGRNDPCPCGSGKKYKHCCLVKEKTNIHEKEMNDLMDYCLKKGMPVKTINLTDNLIKIPPKEEIKCRYKLSYVSETNFVKSRLREDVLFFFFMLSDVLYSNNKKFIEIDRNIDVSSDNYDDIVRDNVRADFLGEVKKIRKEITDAPNFKRLTKPFETYNTKENLDAVTLYKDGKISFFQVLTFHYYLIEWLSCRFNEYRYIPASGEIEGNLYGLNQHRGFDYVLAMAINLEMQLGIHIIIEDVLGKKKLRNPSGEELYFPQLEYVIEPVSLNRMQFGSRYLLFTYFQMIESVGGDYKPEDELLSLYKQTSMTELDCKERMATLSKDNKQPSHYYYDYLSALKCMCIALIHEDYARNDLFSHSLSLCSQIDYIKTIYGIESLYSLFNKSMKEHFKMNEEDLIDVYHSAVFYFLDEKNGLANGLFPDDLVYMDSDREVNPLESTHNKYYLKNPAINEIYYFDHNHFRIDIYELLEGRFIPIYYDKEIVCSVPILPFIFNKGTMDIEEMKFVNYPKYSIYDHNIRIRQELIGMFREITDIHVSEIREYLSPTTFYSWLNNNSLRQQLKELNKTIDSLRIKLAVDMSSDNEEIRESALSRFQNDTVASISALSKDSSLLDDATDNQSEIISFLSEGVWNKLADESKKYLLTSRKTFKIMLEMDPEDELDYSGVCLLITKAIDVEMFRRFFKEYKRYLARKYDKDYSKWPRCMLNEKCNKPISEKCITLGSIIYLMGMNQDKHHKKLKVNGDSQEYQEFIQFSSKELFHGFSVADVKDMLYKDAVFIETARIEYRNKSAHRDGMDQNKAQMCSEYVIERIKILRQILEPMSF